jgi:cytolysin-activating lysine-acyltransferase
VELIVRKNQILVELDPTQEWLTAPAMALRQFRLFHDTKKPVAVALWAFVSDEVDKELSAGRQRLRLTEWKSGNNIWLMDIAARLFLTALKPPVG